MVQDNLVLPGLNPGPINWAGDPAYSQTENFIRKMTHPWMFWEDVSFLTFL